MVEPKNVGGCRQKLVGMKSRMIAKEEGNLSVRVITKSELDKGVCGWSITDYENEEGKL